MPGKQENASAPSAAEKRKRLAKDRKKSRLRNRNKINSVTTFSAERAAEIASRVSSSISVISAPVNLSERIAKAGAAASEQAQRDRLADLALASVDAAAKRAAAAIDVARAVEAQNAQTMADLKGDLSRNAENLRSTFEGGVGSLNGQQEAAMADFERQAAAAAAAAMGKGMEKMVNAAAGVRDELAAAAAAAAAEAGASTSAAAALTLANFKKAMADFDRITLDMDKALANLKTMALGGQKALDAAAKLVANCIQEMADSIPGCEGEIKIKMYFCPIHVVYAEKERSKEDSKEGTCKFIQRAYENVAEEIVNGPEHGKHYKFSGSIGVNKRQQLALWPSICCEREFTTFKDGWSKTGSAEEAKRFTYAEYPMRLAHRMATNNKAFNWTQILFSEDARQKTVNREFIKLKNPDLANHFNTNDIAKIYFNSKNIWNSKDGSSMEQDDAALLLEQFSGGQEDCNDYTTPIVTADSTTIIALLAALIKSLVHEEIMASRLPGYCQKSLIGL